MSYTDEIKRLKEKRARVWGEAQALHASRGADLAGAELDTFRKQTSKVQELTKKIAALEEARGVDGALAVTNDKRDVRDNEGFRTTPASADEYNDVFKNFMRGGLGELKAREKAVLRTGFTTTTETRALGITAGTAGGYTIPEDFWARISEVQKWYGGMDSVGVNVLTTSDGADIPWPTNDDTANVGALLAENTPVTDLDLSFGARMLSAYTYTTNQVKVSLQLLADSAFDLEGFIARKFGQRLGRIHNTHFTVGDGVSKPQGIITGSPVGKTAASSTAIAYTDVVDLIHSVDPAYRNAGRARLMLHDLILAALQKLVDSQNRPLWLPSLRDGQPDTFLGYPYTINNDMDSTIASGKNTIAFGDFFQAYVRRDVKGATLIRLDERYADFLQVAFIGFDRVDGMVDDFNAVKLLRH